MTCFLLFETLGKLIVIEGYLDKTKLEFFVLMFLMAKWVWKLLTVHKSLCLSILLVNYMHRRSFLTGQVRAQDSPFWKAVMKVISLLRSGVCWQVGNRDSNQLLDGALGTKWRLILPNFYWTTCSGFKIDERPDWN